MPKLSFTRVSRATSEVSAFDAHNLVLAGWTGRDETALRRHIEELALLGVKPPPSVPVFYRTGAELLTQTTRLQVLGPDTSGEVEYVLLAYPDGLWVTVGSDQTDRKAETIGIALSKQLCGKVLATTAWRLDDLASRWDDLVLRAWATIGGRRELYQEARLGEIRGPAELIERYAGRADLEAGTVLMSGTPAAKGGIRPASRFELMLEDPRTGADIRHAYDIDVLPVIG